MPSGVSAVRGLLGAVSATVQGTLQFDWTPLPPKISARTVTGVASKSRLYLRAACNDQATTSCAGRKACLLSELGELRQARG